MAFATAEDVATRLVRALTDEEAAAAELLLDMTAAEIRQVVGRTEAELPDEDAPAVLRSVSIEAVCREMASPIGAEATAETMGSYTYRVDYFEKGGTLLTEEEKRLIRRAFGASTFTAATLVSPYSENGDDLPEILDVLDS
jgi:hypothetical protein